MGSSKSTTTTRKSKAKTSTRKSAPAGDSVIQMVEKPSPKPDNTTKIEPKLVTFSDPVVSEPDLKKRELVDLVVERSGVKKKDVKPVVEAMLAVLGETIAKGRELNLQPLGKLRINRSNIKGNGRVIICKLRQSLASQDTPDDPLAEVTE